MPRSSAVDQALEDRLKTIVPGNGFITDLRGVFGPLDSPKDNQPTPYCQWSVVNDSRTGRAGKQCTRMRSYQIEVFFSKAAAHGALSDAHVDLIRCFGFDQLDVDRQFPGLVGDEEEATPVYPAQGVHTMRLLFNFSVTYVETYR
ncbi:MAG: hypothetical protein CVV07_07380 [Gammaproteobacteria bacterium HGW-Gammaproteobacteria-11]|nr:MAG: hypothetical protein CVV07_07380 [Gammaproteobacteria bacterium HGW-Gammaproteobacteria-11]